MTVGGSMLRLSGHRDRLALVAAVVVPLAVTLALVPFRTSMANTDAALMLVLVIVAVAATGNRVAGVLSAVLAGVWFDFFLTAPYERLTITRQVDVETTVLLLLVGVAVTELAVWGRRQQAEVSRRAGYAIGIRDAAQLMSGGLSPTAMVDQVGERLCQLLGLRACRFDYAAGILGGGDPRLRSDGEVEMRGVVQDVERDGLPSDRDIELLVTVAGSYHGRFVLRAHEGSHPSLAQRLIAVALADRLGQALAAPAGPRGR